MDRLSLEQIAALAPDAKTLERAKKLAKPKNFREAGSDGRALWAVAVGSSAYETCIDLQGPAYRCSCPVPRPPCKHALGLLVLAATDPEQIITAAEPPAIHAEWLAKRDAAAEARANRASGQVKDPKAQARRVEQREQNVARGLEELQRFLEDTVRIGLAATAQRTGDVWDRVQRRLIDAQARGLANYLGWMRARIGVGADWTEQVLFALARLHLLTAAYEGREQLAPDLVADLRESIGWSRTREQILAHEPAHAGQWLALNRALRYESGLYTQTVWLLEPALERFALSLSFATEFNLDALDTGYEPGTLVPAAVHYHSRHQPLRATVVRTSAFERHWPENLDAIETLAHPDLDAAIRAMQHARADAPLLIDWPLLVRGLRPVMKEQALMLADAEGRLLPIDPEYRQRWDFLAVIGPEPATVFLTHNGFFAKPWAVLRDGQWLAINMDERDGV